MHPTVFVDTAGWLALLNSRDGLHKAALALRNSLRRQGTVLITTDFVVIEVADAFAAPPLRKVAVSFIDGLRNSDASYSVEVMPVSQVLLADGWNLYSQRPDKGWSLTDCTSFVVMQQYAMHQALTSDHHFAQAGFQCLLA